MMDSMRRMALQALDKESADKAHAKRENTFTLRAQDESSPLVIGFWIACNIETAPRDKLIQALDIALAMRENTPRKKAD